MALWSAEWPYGLQHGRYIAITYGCYRLLIDEHDSYAGELPPESCCPEP